MKYLIYLTFVISFNTIYSQELKLVGDINKIGSSYPAMLTVFENNLFFTANDWVHGPELWKCDTLNHLELIDMDTLSSSNPSEAKVVNNKLCFIAGKCHYDSIDESYSCTHKKLWTYDVNGTFDSIPDSSYIFSYFNNFYKYKNLLLFFKVDNNYVYLWKYDGVNKPEKIFEYKIQALEYTRLGGVVCNNTFYFFPSAYQLWKYDGVNKPEIAIDFLKDAREVIYGNLTAYKNMLYFVGSEPNYNSQIFKYDLIHLPSIAFPNTKYLESWPGDLMVFHDKLFFGVEHGIHGRDLWEYNGTDSAIRVNDIYPNENFTQPGDFHIFHNTLYFSAKDSTHGMELWKYDDVNQPAMVVDINSGPESSDPNRLVNFNNKLYFSADDGIHGQELWMLSDNQTINKVKRQSNIPITIFPNPTTGQFTISFGSSPIQKSLVEICDLQGKQLLSETFCNTTTATIDLAGYPKTIYLIRLSLNGEIIEKKISLQ